MRVLETERQSDYYELLGVGEDSAREQIDRRYNELHRFLLAASLDAELKPSADRLLSLVAEAHAVLADPARRRAYDRKRLRGAVPSRVRPSAPAAEATRRTRRSARRKAVKARAAWWRGRSMQVVVGGAALGLVVVLLVVAGTGNWHRVTGLFGGTAASEARVAELEAVVKREPANAAALFELGEMYFGAEDWPNVVLWRGKLLEVAPSNTYALNDMALASFYLGRNAEARAAWDRALDLEPDNPLLHYSLAFFLLNSPPYDEAQARAH